MSAWWGREHRAQLPPASGDPPVVETADRAAIARAVRARAPRYAPAWRGAGRDDDAGEAFVRLFGDLAGSVAQRLNQLPAKAGTELLRAAGVMPLLGSPATTLVRFEVSPAAPKSVFVGSGFRLGAAPATGQGDLVEFETTEDLFASPGALARVVLQDGAFFEDVKATDPKAATGFSPFGAKPRAERALWLGISCAVHPGRRLKLAFGFLADATPAARTVGGAPAAETGAALLAWDVLDGKRLRPASVVSDETAALTRDGLAEIRTPAEWRTGQLGGSGAPLYWIRVRVASGEQLRDQRLAWVLLNCTRAAASATLRNQALEPLDGPEGARWRLPRIPAIPGTLQLVVDDPGAALAGAPVATPWREVEDIGGAGPTDPVYTLDAADGVVTFGDGVRGAKLPVGYRHVRASQYRVAFGAESAIEADALTTLLSSAPLLLRATNRVGRWGGGAAGRPAETIGRGPAERRAGGRAVAVADYALLARQAEGAFVTRALAVSAHHAEMPGAVVPGVVGVLVLGQRRPSGPPLPRAEELAAVARHLQRVAPAGIEIVTAAPRFHVVSAEVAIGVAPGADATETVLRTIEALDGYFDPLTGGEDGRGWPMGGTVLYADLRRRLLIVAGVESIVNLTLTVDGRRGASCEDARISPYGLLWPAAHDVVPAAPGGGS